MSRNSGSEPLFSVVVPAFNAAGTVASAVGSVLVQTRPELEVIVVNDGSTDATADVVAGISDPRVQLVSQVNGGLPAARNAGIARARGRYVALLDSDDLLLPRYLELCHQALEQTPRAGFAYTDAYVFDDRSGRVRVRSAMARTRPPVPPPADPDDFLLELLRINFIFVSTMFPRAVVEELGGFDETRGSSEDYELWLKMLLHGYRATWVPGRHALYRRHAGQMSGDLRTMSQSVLAVYEDLPLERMPSAAHRQLLGNRRRAAGRQARLVAPVASLIPTRAIGALKRAGFSEQWYETPPEEVASAFPDLHNL